MSPSESPDSTPPPALANMRIESGWPRAAAKHMAVLPRMRDAAFRSAIASTSSLKQERMPSADTPARAMPSWSRSRRAPERSIGANIRCSPPPKFGSADALRSALTHDTWPPIAAEYRGVQPD